MLDEDVVTSPLNELHGRAKHGFRRALREMVVIALLVAFVSFFFIYVERSGTAFMASLFVGAVVSPFLWITYKLARFVIGR